MRIKGLCEMDISAIYFLAYPGQPYTFSYYVKETVILLLC